MREVLRKALDDRSSMVRWRAAEKINASGFHELVPEMERRLEIEKHEQTRETLAWNIAMLTEGYAIGTRDDDDEVFLVWIRTPGGGMMGTWIKPSDVDEGRVPTIVAEFVEREWGSSHGKNRDG